eukprot:s581_g20.t1
MTGPISCHGQKVSYEASVAPDPESERASCAAGEREQLEEERIVSFQPDRETAVVDGVTMNTQCTLKTLQGCTSVCLAGVASKMPEEMFDHLRVMLNAVCGLPATVDVADACMRWDAEQVDGVSLLVSVQADSKVGERENRSEISWSSFTENDMFDLEYFFVRFQQVQQPLVPHEPF